MRTHAVDTISLRAALINSVIPAKGQRPWSQNPGESYIALDSRPGSESGVTFLRGNDEFGINQSFPGMISRTFILTGVFCFCMMLVLAGPWRTALAQDDAATSTSEPCNDSGAQRGATVKSSKSNSSDRTAAPQATKVKGSKSNSSERQANPCAATTVKSGKSNSSERQVAPPPPPPPPAESANLNLSKSNINAAPPPPPPAETANLNFSKSNVNRQAEEEPEGVTEDTDGDL